MSYTDRLSLGEVADLLDQVEGISAHVRQERVYIKADGIIMTLALRQARFVALLVWKAEQHGNREAKDRLMHAIANDH